MTKDDFISWVRLMNIKSGHNNTALAELLGVSERNFYRYKRSGGPKMLALACAALWYDKEPYVK